MIYTLEFRIETTEVENEEISIVYPYPILCTEMPVL